MKRTLPAIAAFVMGLSALPAAAEDAIEHRYQTWLAAFAHGPIVNDVWLWTDLHARFYDSFEPSQILVRPGLSYHVRKPLFLTVGYAWTPGFQQLSAPRAWGELDFIDEHRAWEQIMWTPVDEATGNAAQVRARLEQRFRPEFGGVGLRLRVLARGQVPITRGREWMFVVWDEVFVALDDARTWQKRGFDQNRLFIGLGWQVVPTVVRLELGYGNQWLARDGVDPVNHLLALNGYFGWH